jgi:putative ABC transport system permease protein
MRETPIILTVDRDAIGNFLFDVNPREPLTFAAVLLLVGTVSLVATLVPARRATRVDPQNSRASEKNHIT